MIICVCEGVSDRVVRDAAQKGAHCLNSIQRACRAGADCGSCRPALRKLLREVRGRSTEQRQR